MIKKYKLQIFKEKSLIVSDVFVLLEGVIDGKLVVGTEVVDMIELFLQYKSSLPLLSQGTTALYVCNSDTFDSLVGIIAIVGLDYKVFLYETK